MTMMHVREMRMGVRDVRMLMNVAVRFLAVPRKFVIMLMVLIMNMRMLMSHRFMCVRMFVMFGEVEPNADSHQCAGAQQRQGSRLAQHEGQQRPEERRD